jgi:hypothetical protein
LIDKVIKRAGFKFRIAKKYSIFMHLFSTNAFDRFGTDILGKPRRA